LGEIRPSQIIDIRQPDAFRRGHLEGAQNIPYEQFQVEIESQVSPEEWVLIVDTAGARAAEMAMWLKTRNYRASSLEGGMFAWRGEIVTGS
jgi:rhodanese-related sulfurtransferase